MRGWYAEGLKSDVEPVGEVQPATLVDVAALDLVNLVVVVGMAQVVVTDSVLLPAGDRILVTVTVDAELEVERVGVSGL